VTKTYKLVCHVDLQQIHEWKTANRLKLNPEKNQVILIHRCRAETLPPSLLIGANVVKVVLKVKNLGFVLNGRFTATDHFRKVCQRVYWILRSLGPHAANSPFEVKRRLVLSLVLPHVNYGNIVFTGADSASRRLGVAFKACSCFTFGVDYNWYVIFIQVTACLPSFLSVFSVSFCLILRLLCRVLNSLPYDVNQLCPLMGGLFRP
jgi:hypothetical protein